MKIDHLRTPQGFDDWQRKKELETDEGWGGCQGGVSEGGGC